MHALTPAAWLTWAPGCCAPGELAHLRPQSSGEQSLWQRGNRSRDRSRVAEKLLLHYGAAASAAL